MSLAHFVPSDLLMDILHVTQATAISCEPCIGAGDPKEADRIAVAAMRKAFQRLPVKGTVVMGEGERDKAALLYVGEQVGRWGDNHPEWDIVVDPLEGTNLCAQDQGGAISVLAMAPKGGLFQAPDVYMDKIACGPAAKGVIDLNHGVEKNISSVAAALDKLPTAMVVAVLDRPRHQDLIKSIYQLGARVQLIDDGDLSAALQTCRRESGIDLVMGVGGAPEGVLAASALKCLGGDFQGRFVFHEEEQRHRAINMGMQNLDQIYSLEDLVRSSVVFCATGVTSGALLKGLCRDVSYSPLRPSGDLMTTESLYMDSVTEHCLTIQSTTWE